MPDERKWICECGTWTWNDKSVCHSCHKPKPSAKPRGIGNGNVSGPKQPAGITVEVLADGSKKYKGIGKQAKLQAKKLNKEENEKRVASSLGRPIDMPAPQVEDRAKLDELKSCIALKKKYGIPTMELERQATEIESKSLRPDTPGSCALKVKRATEAFEKAHGQFIKTRTLLEEQEEKVKRAAQLLVEAEDLNREVLAEAASKAMVPPKKEIEFALSVPDIIQGNLPKLNFGTTFDCSELELSDADRAEIKNRENLVANALQESLKLAFGDLMQNFKAQADKMSQEHVKHLEIIKKRKTSSQTSVPTATVTTPNHGTGSSQEGVATTPIATDHPQVPEPAGASAPKLSHLDAARAKAVDGKSAAMAV